MYANRLFFILLSLSSLTACGPFYQTFTLYDPPASQQGKNCAFGCEQTHNACDAQCKDDYDACYREAELQGKSDYLDAKERWLDRRDHCANTKTSTSKKLKDQVKAQEHSQDDSACNEREPVESSFINTYHCKSDCGCEDMFQRCFQLCGGQIRYEQRCVSGCEQ